MSLSLNIIYKPGSSSSQTWTYIFCQTKLEQSLLKKMMSVLKKMRKTKRFILGQSLATKLVVA